LPSSLERREESPSLVPWRSIELAVIEHGRNPTVLARHKEGICADKSVIDVAITPAACGVFYTIAPS
jgi:hypothetical protein